jgi:hypothetical protein
VGEVAACSLRGRAQTDSSSLRGGRGSNDDAGRPDLMALLWLASAASAGAEKKVRNCIEKRKRLRTSWNTSQ